MPVYDACAISLPRRLENEASIRFGAEQFDGERSMQGGGGMSFDTTFLAAQMVQRSGAGMALSASNGLPAALLAALDSVEGVMLDATVFMVHESGTTVLDTRYGRWPLRLPAGDVLSVGSPLSMIARRLPDGEVQVTLRREPEGASNASASVDAVAVSRGGGAALAEPLGYQPSRSVPLPVPVGASQPGAAEVNVSVGRGVALDGFPVQAGAVSSKTLSGETPVLSAPSLQPSAPAGAGSVFGSGTATGIVQTPFLTALETIPSFIPEGEASLADGSLTSGMEMEDREMTMAQVGALSPKIVNEPGLTLRAQSSYAPLGQLLASLRADSAALVPRAEAGLAAALAVLFPAVAAGGVRKWLKVGDSTLSADGSAAASRLDTAMAAVRGGPGGAWEIRGVPLLVSGEPTMIVFAVKPDEHSGGHSDNDDEGEGTRFAVAVHLPEFGHVRMDGVILDGRMSLRMVADTILDPEEADDVAAAYAEALSEVGMNGALALGAGPRSG